MDKFSWPEKPSQVAFPIAKAGYSFIFAAAFVTTVFALSGLVVLSLISLVITFCICGFFRDPDRVVPNVDGAVVSPADGKVVFAEAIDNNPFVDGSCIKISIFMSVFNVHVNRIPCTGKIKKVSYYPGKFFSANLDKASKENEHNAIFLETGSGEKVCFVQIAGLIARRIICGLQEGDQVIRGRRFGMICFGSRLDVYLPENTKLNVALGERVEAGHSVLGYLA